METEEAVGCQVLCEISITSGVFACWLEKLEPSKLKWALNPSVTVSSQFQNSSNLLSS